MISAGIEGRLPYMTYPEPWGGPPKQPPEFLRPAPKPLPPNRYNGVTISTSLNGTRLGPPQRPQTKYPSPPAATPVNLTQPKEEPTEELPYSVYSRLLPPPPPFMYHHAGPYTSLYQPPYTPPLRTNYPQPPPLSPLEPPYTPTTPSASAAAIFLSPSTFSPPAVVQQQQPSHTATRAERKPSPSFKVPSGKEGSLKHRILTRPGDGIQHTRHHTLEAPKLSETTRKRLTATVSPPRSPAKTGNNNVVPLGNFIKGALIQLANGELRRVEDMRTEDFVNSAERSPELRLADSTVVRIEENPITGTGTVTLSYNQRRTQVEFESTLEHPFFVYGQGWTSCAPDRTLQIYGLKVHQLQVGDIVISLTPRESISTPVSTRGSTIITTATTTAVTARQVSSTSEPTVHSYRFISPSQNLPNISTVSGVNCHPGVSQQSNTISPDCSSSKKRRWSAPDQICDENEQNVRKFSTYHNYVAKKSYEIKLPKSKSSSILSRVWEEFLRSETIYNGFRKPGIYPFCDTILPNEIFEPATLKRFKVSLADNSSLPSRSIPSVDDIISDPGCSEGTAHNLLNTTTTVYASGDNNVDNTQVEAGTSMGNEKYFETILLKYIKNTPSARTEQQKRRKICPGAEVITSLDVIEKLKEKKKHSTKHGFPGVQSDSGDDFELGIPSPPIEEKIHREVQQDDFVLMKFPIVRGSGNVYYAAKVLNCFDQEVEVSCLRKSIKSENSTSLNC
ncbi:hypothetical protein FQA39_LY01792 [Lamprigera yunnana]|nr:hypothetical protein FQA39_LY01792 [Lamprigera yunnana]